MAVGGAFLGWRLTVTAAVIAVVCTGGWCGIMIAAGKRNRKDRFALGPFLCLGMLAVVLAGDKIAII
jgi:leader peptidase (prepilin peptidase)/N-methyltransferase